MSIYYGSRYNGGDTMKRTVQEIYEEDEGGDLRRAIAVAWRTKSITRQGAITRLQLLCSLTKEEAEDVVRSWKL